MVFLTLIHYKHLLFSHQRVQSLRGSYRLSFCTQIRTFISLPQAEWEWYPQLSPTLGISFFFVHMQWNSNLLHNTCCIWLLERHLTLYLTHISSSTQASYFGITTTTLNLPQKWVSLPLLRLNHFKLFASNI